MNNIQSRMEKIKNLQTDEGYWKYNFEGAILTDCFMMIIIRTLNIKDEQIVSELAKRLIRLQNENGAWKIYSNEKDGNLSATVQAYTALLVSGLYTRKDEEMKRAESFIKANGGLSNVHFMTKMMLAINGLYDYPSYFYFPMTYFLLPPVVPFSMYHCSNYARVHLTPMIISMNKKFAITHNIDSSFFKHESEGNWFKENRDSWTNFFIEEVKHIALTPLHLHKAGYKAAEKLMLDRIENNGTLYSYASSTFYMIYALLALGYDKKTKLFKNAVAGIRDYITNTKTGMHVQNSPSTVWDTALLTYALQEAGIPENHSTIKKAIKYLVSKQQYKRGDWAVNAPQTSPGGWGFSDTNSFIPDNDDTSAVLRAISRTSKSDKNVMNVSRKGLSYLLSMQNKDGGWGAFEKNAYQPILKHLPLENAKDALIDCSTPDLTGRVLEYLGNFAGYNNKLSIIKNAANWLIKEQQSDGSWYGKWGVCYIYGTWAAITGLRAVGISKVHSSIANGIKWLESIQRSDGGWGESCASAEHEKYVPLPFSTPSQTAWALDALLTVQGPDSSSVKRAVQYLLNQTEIKKEAVYYPTGLGLPGGFYIYYESYNELFPLLALAHYKKKLLS